MVIWAQLIRKNGKDVPDIPKINNNIKFFFTKLKLNALYKAYIYNKIAAMVTLENAIKIGENDFRDISISKKALPKSITSNEK